jgi:hypothetical protein
MVRPDSGEPPALDDAALAPSVLGSLIRARWREPLLQSLYLLLQLINLLPKLINLLPKFAELSLSGSQLFSESLLHRR